PAPNTGARLYTLRTNVDQSFLQGKIKVNVGLNATRNSLNRGLSNNDNTNTSPIYAFAYTPGVINLDSVGATGTYVRNPFNGGGSTISNPFETFQYLQLNELVSRQIGNLSATWAALSQGQHQISLTAIGGLDRAQVSGDLFSPSFVQYENNDGFLGTAVRTEGNIFNDNVYVGGNWNYQPSGGLSFTTTGGFSYESQYNRVLRDRARGLLPGVETTNSGTVRDGSDSVYGEFRDMAWVANEQVLALDQRLTLAGGVRADRSSANIKPETLTEIEAGTDVTFINRRLQFEGTGYSRKITDLLLQPATIPSGGLTNLVINGGELSNIGIELGLTAAAVQTHDLDWS